MPLHHEDIGQVAAPALLLGGSLGTNLQMWEGQLPLADHMRLLPFDHRGHGGSPVPPGPYEIGNLGEDVLELMDALGLDRASYCGVSLGGMVGMWLGINAPDRIDRLVLICTSAHMPPRSMWQERTEAVRSAGSVEPIADPVLDRWLTPEFAQEHAELRDELRWMLVHTSPEGYASCCTAIERMDLRAELSQISAPTLVVSGSEDPSTPPEHQRLIADAIPGARHETVAPAAHLAVVEQPEQVNILMMEHLS